MQRNNEETRCKMIVRIESYLNYDDTDNTDFLHKHNRKLSFNSRTLYSRVITKYKNTKCYESTAVIMP